jgi:hypothetical protein
MAMAGSGKGQTGRRRIKDAGRFAKPATVVAAYPEGIAGLFGAAVRCYNFKVFSGALPEEAAVHVACAVNPHTRRLRVSARNPIMAGVSGGWRHNP